MQDALGKIEGVLAVKASFRGALARVIYDPVRLTPDALRTLAASRLGIPFRVRAGGNQGGM